MCKDQVSYPYKAANKIIVLYNLIRWCSITGLNVHAPCEDKSDDVKDSFYEELRCVFNQFPRYHTKILFSNFNVKVGRENIFKLIIVNESLHDISNDNGVRVVKFATSRKVVFK
jgi:hypothetical protein